jgi:hypothetical protein
MAERFAPAFFIKAIRFHGCRSWHVARVPVLPAQSPSNTDCEGDGNAMAIRTAREQGQIIEVSSRSRQIRRILPCLRETEQEGIGRRE